MLNPREIRLNLTFPKKTKSAPEPTETITAEATVAPSKRNYDQMFRYVAVAATAFIVIDTFRQIKIEEAKAPHL
jgi:hypothetical protein